MTGVACSDGCGVSALDEMALLEMLGPAVNRRNLGQWAAVLWQRYCRDPAQSYGEIGDSIGVSRDRARQIISEAIRALRTRWYRERALVLKIPHGTRLHHAVWGCWHDESCGLTDPRVLGRAGVTLAEDV